MSCLDEAERRARMVLSQVAEPGDADVCRLVRDHSADDLLRRLREGGLVDSAKVVGWVQRASIADAGAIAAAAAEVGARFVCPGDQEWPAGLDDLIRLEDEGGERRGGAPFGLWLRGQGSLSALSRRCVAIVGSRASTAYGEHVATNIAFDTVGRGFTIVSGGAYGIDAAAHRSALAGEAATIAVLAGGIDRLYPAGNIRMLERISERGLLVSEAAPGATPTKSRFLVRNRLIAALSQGTVVVEAALRSGALNTARWALDLSRLVMGVPGPVTSMASGGVHELLRQPGTLLVTDAHEVVEHVSPAGVGLAPRKIGVVREADGYDRDCREVLDAIPKVNPADASTIAVTAGVSIGDVGRHLGLLHSAGLVVPVADGWTLAPI